MKHLTLLILATLAFTPKAHAIHAYHNNWCRVAESERQLPFQLRANYDWIEATPLKHMQGDPTSIAGSIVNAVKPLQADQEFLAKEMKVTNEKTETHDDGCWSGTEGSYDAVMVILNVSKKALALGMKAGMEIAVHCTTEDLDPDGSSC